MGGRVDEGGRRREVGDEERGHELDLVKLRLKRACAIYRVAIAIKCVAARMGSTVG